ncbi:hypothetical protein NDU88_000229 [Pleurodeles waltl]|uniref:Uncharacterized protein n=1 Tax=Pleurodeles waltl TaxID=8319 RepID=A0AAV7V8D5_PLEWA|nr:hypothetical protein NDU88_000229 [Pleurodeles waltl]
MVIGTYHIKDSPFFHDSITRILPLFNKFFTSEIILGGSTDQCVAVMEKWQRNEPGALDWSDAAMALWEGNRDAWPEKQSSLQRKINHILKYDISKCNPFSPTVLPPADCLILPHCFELHVTDKEGFCSALKNASSLLKNGGHLILIACLEATFYMVGSFKFPHLCMHESFIRKALTDADYDIEELHVFPRTVNKLYDVADYSALIVVHARKKC